MARTNRTKEDASLSGLRRLQLVLLVLALLLAVALVADGLLFLRPSDSLPAEPPTEQSVLPEPSESQEPSGTPSASEEPEQGRTKPEGDPDKTSPLPSDETSPEPASEPTDSPSPTAIEPITPTSKLSPKDRRYALEQRDEVDQPGANTPAMLVFIILWVLLGLDLVALVVVSAFIRKKQAEPEYTQTAKLLPQVSQENVRSAGQSGPVTVGKLHQIGARPYQEDSVGVAMLEDGALAVVADGMGGLSGGDKVSKKIVLTMLDSVSQLKTGLMDGILPKLVNNTNEAVNQMLGPDGLYQSGSTLLAVLARGGRFHWIAVGDSHIYFYRNGKLIQLNQEHNRGQELLRRAIRGELTIEEVRRDPKKSGLTSFVGMGRLKYVEQSLESIPLQPGDRVALMTDGVFNALPDQTIAAVLEQFPDVEQAAAEIERLVLQCNHPGQDNFTAVILGF